MRNKEFGLLFKTISHLLHNQSLILQELNTNNIYAINATDELSTLSGQLGKAYYKKDNDMLDTLTLLKLKETNPNQEITIEINGERHTFQMKDVSICENKPGKMSIRIEKQRIVKKPTIFENGEYAHSQYIYYNNIKEHKKRLQQEVSFYFD